MTALRPTELSHHLVGKLLRILFRSVPARKGWEPRLRLETGQTNSALGYDDLVLHIRSEPTILNVARQLVAAACDRAGLTPRQTSDFVLAVNEATTNAVKYGSPAGKKDFVTIRCARTNRALVVSVTDHGAGFRHKNLESHSDMCYLPSSGLGLPLMRRLSDDLKIRSDTHGTTVSIAKWISPLAKAA